MVEQVNKLIYNTLCAGRDIYIPQVGSLVVRCISSSLQSSKRLVPPRYRVTLTGEQRGESLVEIIAQSANVTTERAEDIYRQWLNAVKREGVVTIEDVGHIEDKSFNISPQLHNILNPHSLEPIILKPRTNWGVVASLVATLIGVAGVIAWLLLPAKAVVETQDAPMVVEVEKSDSVVEQSVVVEPVQAVEPEIEVVAEVVEPASAAVAPEPEIGTLTKGKSYIVWGVYSQIENARKYKELVESRYQDISCAIYHYKNNTLYMVALAQTDTRSEALGITRSLKERGKFFEQLWICTL